VIAQTFGGRLGRAGAQATKSASAPATGAATRSAADNGFEYKSAPGPFEIATADAAWHDKARDRDVPVRIFSPKAAPKGAAPSVAPTAGATTRPTTQESAAAALPLVVFSPGLGGSREVYGYFAKHLAGYGYIVVVVTHKGTDTEYFLTNGFKALWQTLGQDAVWADRAADISFVIDRLLAKDQDQELIKGRVDAQRIGVAGHSYGAFTSLAIAGQVSTAKDGKAHAYADARVKAVITMCPQWLPAFGVDERSWDKIAIPAMIMTGTRDPGMMGKSPQRSEIFAGMPKGDKYFMLMEGAGHMAFATNGKLFSKDETEDPSHFHDWIRQCGVAFFDAYLLGDKKAQAWLLSRRLGFEL
jgi:predicted dienelactone hydrolase